MPRTAEDWRKLAIKVYEQAEAFQPEYSLTATELFTQATAAATIAMALSRASSPSRKVSSVKRNLKP